MVNKTIPVNKKGNDLSTFGGRLASQRDLLKLKQVDLCIRLGVSKTTQIKYESGASYPDARYLADLHALGFDVMYILTGTRDADALSGDLQNLVDAYIDAPESLKRAALGALLSPYLHDINMAMKQPGYIRHMIKGEEDVRYEETWRKALETPSDKPKGE